MKTEHAQTQILELADVDVTPDELRASIKTSTNRPKIYEIADNTLKKVRGRWRPRVVVRWLGVDNVTDTEVVLSFQKIGKPARLALGHACEFMVPAEQALVGVYTAGDELELVAATATRENRAMDAYFYNLIGLAVLEKTRQYVNEIVENKAREMSWGVGPFLSPGSVHGWELTDQPNVCALVPIDMIGVEMSESGVFKPYKTIACLIGIGPEYKVKKVGSTCDVCSKNKVCEMRKTKQGKTIIHG